jgi:hypothetical protein
MEVIYLFILQHRFSLIIVSSDERANLQMVQIYSQRIISVDMDGGCVRDERAVSQSTKFPNDEACN